MVANKIASSKVEKARNEVLAAESLRQKDFDRQVQQLNTQSQDRYVGFEPQQEQRAAQLGDVLATSVAPDANSVAATIMPASTSDIVNQETADRRAEAQGYVDQQSGALGDMRAFGDLLGETSTLQARDASKIGQIGGFKIGSQGIVPYELDQAAKAGDGMAMLGDILRMGGSIATGAGIGGGNIANMFGGSSGFFPGLTGPSLGGAPSAWGL